MSNAKTLAEASLVGARQLLAATLDLLLPQTCALCGQTAGRKAVCAACTADLAPHGGDACPRCGDSSSNDDICGRCLRAPPGFTATHAAFVYAFPADRLVHALKYGGQLHLARWFADAIAATLPKEAFDLIVPMPLHASRLAERGFNQAGEIARHLAARTGIPLALDACVRNRATTPQSELVREQRRKNVRGAFDCRMNMHDRRVLLIDDVMTTGASMNELAQVINAAGASRVVAAVVARTRRAEVT